MTSALESVRQRVSAFFENDDTSAVLDHGAEADAVAVLEDTVQAVFAEGAMTMEHHLDVLYVLGWLFWSRFTMADSWGDRNGLLATALFAPMCDAQPTAVPEPVLNTGLCLCAGWEGHVGGATHGRALVSWGWDGVRRPLPSPRPRWVRRLGVDLVVAGPAHNTRPDVGPFPARGAARRQGVLRDSSACRVMLY